MQEWVTIRHTYCKLSDRSGYHLPTFCEKEKCGEGKRIRWIVIEFEIGHNNASKQLLSTK